MAHAALKRMMACSATAEAQAPPWIGSYVLDLGQGYRVKFYATRSQRAPVAEALYAFGPHGATATFERGDPALDMETAINLDVALDYQGERLFAELGVYYERVNDFVYLQEVGGSTPTTVSPPRFGTVDVYLQGRNVLNEEGRRATSFLKDVAPLPGASLVMGLRLTI